MDTMHGELRDLLNEVCHTEAVCGECKEKGCLVGYARHINTATIDMKPPHLEGAYENRPIFDMRGGYDEDHVLRVLASTLHYCRGCKDHHNNSCVLAVIRDCMEQILWGEEIHYEGNPLNYLVKVGILDETKGSALTEIYNQEKARVRD